MKKLLAIAAFLLASTAAQAQYTFDYGGRTIRIDPDRGTVQIPGVYDNTRKAKRSRDDDDYRDDYRDRPRRSSPQESRSSPPTPPDGAAPAGPAPSEQAAVPAGPAIPAAPAPPTPEPSTATAAIAPADPVTPPSPPAAPQVQQEPPPAPQPAPAVAAVTPPPAPPAAAPQAANSPLGVWLTEKKDGKEGRVRIEQCGPNLCGYSVDRRSDRNGEQVLINMKPGNNKWSGRIFDPSSGSTYDSTIALKGSNSLRVQGCAFGGMFCGGQTWTRLN